MKEYAWHDWFAWRPVLTTTGEMRWLVFVERRRLYSTATAVYLERPWLDYEYRDISGRLGERLMPAGC